MVKIEKGLTKNKITGIFILISIFLSSNIAYSSNDILRPPLITQIPEGKEQIMEIMSRDIWEEGDSEIEGDDYSQQIRDIIRYKIYDEQLLHNIMADLKEAIEKGIVVFEALPEKRKMEVYNLAGLLELTSRLKDIGVDEDKFSFDPATRFFTALDINTKPSRGYLVETGTTWSRLTIQDYQIISNIEQSTFPLANISFLNLCGGYGYSLLQIAPLLHDSLLVLLEANSENVLHAMRILNSAQINNNRYEIKLTDARLGFGGIPYADGTFDVISMVGYSEEGMSFDDIDRLMFEALRVIKHDRGVFLLETRDMDRFAASIDKALESDPSIFDFDVKTYVLESMLILVEV